MMSYTPCIQEQYLTTYRRAECEDEMLCMVYAESREAVLVLIEGAVQRYTKLRVELKVDLEKLIVTLPNKSRVHYVVMNE